jgi:hypothetical protein
MSMVRQGRVTAAALFKNVADCWFLGMALSKIHGPKCPGIPSPTVLRTPNCKPHRPTISRYPLPLGHGGGQGVEDEITDKDGVASATRPILRVSGFSGLELDEPFGQRWEAALQVLASGESAIRLPGIRLVLDVHGPRSTGQLLISIEASFDAKSLTHALAEADVQRGLRNLALARAADVRFAEFLDTRQIVIDYIDDYGMGTVRLAVIAADDDLRRENGWEPIAGG